MVGVAAVLLVLAFVVGLPIAPTCGRTCRSATRRPSTWWPTLAFALLFVWMAAHWLWLLCTGLSQKLWLRAKVG